MTPPSLYSRIGGEGGVEELVVGFYSRVLEDPTLARFFMNLDTPRLIRKQIAFITFAFGGVTGYSGLKLREAHRGAAGRGMTDAHFDAVVGHFRAALEEKGVGEAEIAEALAIVESVRSEVLCR